VKKKVILLPVELYLNVDKFHFEVIVPDFLFAYLVGLLFLRSLAFKVSRSLSKGLSNDAFRLAFSPF